MAFKRSDIAHGKITSIDTKAAAAMDGVEAVYTGADIAKILAPMPIGTPFPSPPHHAVAVDTVRYAGEPVAVVVACGSLRGARRRRRHCREVRPAAGGGRSRTGDDRQAHGDPPRLSEQPCGGPRAERHRRCARFFGDRQHRGRQGVCRRGSGDQPAHDEPSPGAERDGAARRDRALGAGQGVDDDLVVDAEPAHSQDDDRGDERPRTAPGPCHRAGSGRRLRRQDQHLRRGVRGVGGVEATGHADQVDRRSIGSVRRHHARPRHHRLHRHCREARRQGAGPEDAADCRHRRLQHAADRRHSDPDDVDGERHLRHSRHSHDADGGLHQQDADRRVSRRGPPGSDLLRRARDGHACARAEDGSGRAAAEEFHSVGQVPVPDADGRGVRLGQLRGGPRCGAEGWRIGRA